MSKNNPHSADRFYKFTYKKLGILFHRYLYDEGENIEFIDTEIPETGQRKDMVVIVDGNFIRITEFMSTPLDGKKLDTISKYHISSVNDPQYKGFYVITDVVSIADPNRGKTMVKFDDNLDFHVAPIFTKRKDGGKVLSTLVNKSITQEELSYSEAIDLLILPDMDIDMPIKQLMVFIISLMGMVNIQDKEFKKSIIHCEIFALSRFFAGNDWSELIEMLRAVTDPQEVDRVIEKYGIGFDEIYFDGKADGFAEGRNEGRNEGWNEGWNEGRNEGFNDGRLLDAENFLAKGIDEEIISECTGVPIKKLEEIKRKL